MELQLDEVRRLTGPNLLWDESGAIIDVFIHGIDKTKVVQCWQLWLKKLQERFGWQQASTYRIHSEGANMALSAPMDALYAACDLAELAWDCCVAELMQQPLPNWQLRLDELCKELADEINPPLLALMKEAKTQGVTCISDDDEVSLGMGRSVEVWPVRALPDLASIDWPKYRDVPRAFITGTNGKSTSVRLASHIAQAAGICAGVTSTDFIRVGDVIIDTGDYSGPGGARMLLRDARTDLAFLEVARGGILRRGIPVESVDAALITNVASDHLGQYGINTVEELAEAKFVVAKGLGDRGILVLNADNDLVIAQASKIKNKLCWFSCDESNVLIQQQIQTGGRAVFIRAKHIVYHANGLFETIIAVDDIAMALGGMAAHNVENALGVVGLCKSLKLPSNAIAQGLKTFGSNAKDNPGRGNIYEVDSYRVVVDFAHNEHSMRAVVNMVRQLSSQRLIVMFSHAGDRSDEEIKSLTDAVYQLNADSYIIAEIENYLRGRQLGEVPELATRFLQQQGVNLENINTVSSPFEGAKLATNMAKNGDIVLLFTLDDRQQVHEYLSALGSSHTQ